MHCRFEYKHWNIYETENVIPVCDTFLLVNTSNYAKYALIYAMVTKLKR